MGKYDDIINLPHHVSPYRQPMPIENRAAQFAPFAALSGHEEAIAETARITDFLIELSEDEKNQINRKLNYALENKVQTEITFFCPDKSKSGGSYKKKQGIIKKCDEIDRFLILNDGFLIKLDFITGIEFHVGYESKCTDILDF